MKNSSLIPLAIMAMISFMAALFLGANSMLVPAAAMHVAFAMGVVPLIFGAMLHFIPVLTLSGTPNRVINALPFLAQILGAVVVSAMQGWLPRYALHGVALVNGIVALVLLVWMSDRARQCVGRPHPGWRWYASALAVLALAMLSIPFMDSDHGQVARLFHMHANTLGFVGLAALGTLPVLLPTVIGKPELRAAWWLQRWCLRMLAGVLALAVGAALFPPLSIVGVAVLLAGIFVLGRRWVTTFGWQALWQDGAAASLALAVAGFCALLLVGVAHGLGLIPARPAIAGFIACFLMPLLTGALTQLLPVWRHPGPLTSAREMLRARLAKGGQVRAILFIAGGLAFLSGFVPVGLALAGIGLAIFVFAPLLPAR